MVRVDDRAGVSLCRQVILTRLEFPSPVVGPTGTGRSIAIFGGEPIIVWPEPTIIIILWGVICGDGVIWGVPQTLMVSHIRRC
jgi:hypothetical protein